MTDMNRRRGLQFAAATLAALALARVTGIPAAGMAASETLRQRRIPSSGEALPVIGLGTWQTFDVGPRSAERAPLRRVLAEFAALGGTLVDSSPMYGASETVLGDLAAQLDLHETLFFATKVWTRGRRAGVEQMQESIRRLRAEPIDLMQVHNLVDVDTHLDTLQAWKKQGHVRYIGVTHYTASAHDDLARVISRRPVDFVQINYSVSERGAERRLLPLARERGIAVIANRPFASGALFRHLRSKPLPGYAADIDCTSWAQLLLKFVISHPAITATIPATSQVEHLRDNMRAGRGPLPDAALRDRIAAELA